MATAVTTSVTAVAFQVDTVNVEAHIRIRDIENVGQITEIQNRVIGQRGVSLEKVIVNPEGLDLKGLESQLDSGKFREWLFLRLYPKLRGSGGEGEFVIPIKITVHELETFLTTDKTDKIVLEDDKVTIGLIKIPGTDESVDTLTSRNVETQKETKRLNTAFALKTNLLSDLILAPNIEVEIPFNRKWSVCLDWTCPWWLFRGNSYCEQLLAAHLQGRRYFGDRENLAYFTGWFVGVQGGLGYYDFQVPEKGAQGEFADIGLGGGYSLRLGEYFNLEFELGLGALYTQYRLYTPMENYSILLYRETKEAFWAGPTRAKVSLVWRIGRKCRSDKR